MLGLRSVSSSGSFALVVGAHHDLPDVIFKVVPKTDAYADFAQLSLDGKVTSKHFPRIDAVVDLGETVLVVVERIAHELDCASSDMSEYYDTIEALDDVLAYGSITELHGVALEMYDEIRAMINATDSISDTHRGNFMVRSDGTLVCIDPIWRK